MEMAHTGIYGERQDETSHRVIQRPCEVHFFIKGVEFTDPNDLFNNGLDAATSRSIDIRIDEKVDQQQLRDLVSQFLEAK